MTHSACQRTLLLLAGALLVACGGGGGGADGGTQSGLSVTTGQASSVTATSVTLGGSVNPQGAAATCRFDYGASTGYGSTTPEQSVAAGTSAVDVTASLAALSPSTTYHFRLTCSTAAGTNSGADATFATSARTPNPSPVPPTATTGAASSISTSAATLNGTANPKGDATTCAFEYGTSSSYGTTTSAQALGTGMSDVPVRADLAGLAGSTTYHFRLSCTNSAGTVHGAEATFVTPAPTGHPPVVTSSAATGITASGAMLHGTVNPSGAASTCRFDYGTSTAYGNTTASQAVASGSAAVSASASVSGLSASTLYHFRLTCSNAGGTASGADTTFTTSAGAPGGPTVTTGAASAVTSSTATLNGTVNPSGAVTSCHFEDGTSTAYGASTPAQSVPAGTAVVGVKADVTGLAVSTAYHFRLVCSNAGGSVNGADATFTTTPLQAGGQIKKVFQLMMENRNANQVYGVSNAPYINNTLMKTYDWASNYTDVVHPSEPNYIWLEAGSNMGLTTDNDPSASNSSATHDHLTNYLGRAGKSWKSYQENLPGACGIHSSGRYASKHNPFVFFQDVVGSYSAPSAYCTSHIVDLSALSQDLSNNNVADYVEISPNLCNDGHDCANPTVEAFLQSAPIQQVFSYVTNPANHAILIINWDEGEGQGVHPMVLIAPPATLSGAHQITTQVDHSSVVRSMQVILGVDPSQNDPTTGKPFAWLHNAGTVAHDLSSFFAAGQYP